MEIENENSCLIEELKNELFSVKTDLDSLQKEILLVKKKEE